jgi:hypothetical protein
MSRWGQENLCQGNKKDGEQGEQRERLMFFPFSEVLTELIPRLVEGDAVEFYTICLAECRDKTSKKDVRAVIIIPIYKERFDILIRCK